MLETYLRPFYQRKFLDPIAIRIKDVSPNVFTFLACVTGIFIAPALALNMTSLAILLLVISGFLDTLDGTVARLTGQSSDLGNVFDIVADRIVEFAIILGLYLIDPQNRGFLTLLILGSCYLCVTSFLVVGIFTPNHSQKGFYYSPGLIERAEAFIFFALMMLFPNYFFMLSCVFIALVVLTSYLRLCEFAKFCVCSQSG